MTESHHGWITNKLSLALAGLANGSAWIHSAIAENVSVGAIVTAGTIMVPALCGAVIYAIKNVGPVWLQFRKDLDAARSSTLAGQMEVLSKQLDISNRTATANQQLATIAKEQADRLQAMYEASEERNKDASASIDTVKVELRKVNEKFHTLLNEANGYKMTAVNLQQELDEYKAHYGPIVEQLAANAQKIHEIDSKVNVAGSVMATPIDHPNP